MSGRRPGAKNCNPFLARLRRSGRLDEADIAALGGLITAGRPVDAGTNLLAGGARAARLHVLLEGWACRYGLLREGGRQITALLLPGDACDLDGLWVDGVDGTVGTLTRCTVASLDGAALRALAARRPGVARGLGWMGAVENAILTECNVSLGRRSARERLAHLLCELLVRLAAVGQARERGYVLPIVQADLGDVVGLSHVHVNRVLQGLRREGMITLKGRELVILDWPRLCATADFRPNYLHLGIRNGPKAAADPAAAAG